jgi:hypothetical protein
MADTEQTWTALQTILADNTARAISPQDLRDAILSCLGGYASMYVNSGAVAQSFTATPALVTCWTGVCSERGATGDPLNDRITIGVGGDYLITVSASMIASVAADVDLYLYKNGVAITGAKTRSYVRNTERSVSMALAVCDFAAGDLVTLYGTATPDSDITFYDAHMTIKRVG